MSSVVTAAQSHQSLLVLGGGRRHGAHWWVLLGQYCSSAEGHRERDGYRARLVQGGRDAHSAAAQTTPGLSLAVSPTSKRRFCSATPDETSGQCPLSSLSRLQAVGLK